jgi:hypothetical protein
VASKSNALSENIEEREVSQPAALSEGLEGRGASDSAAFVSDDKVDPNKELSMSIVILASYFTKHLYIRQPQKDLVLPYLFILQVQHICSVS